MRKGNCCLALAILSFGIAIHASCALAAPLGYDQPLNWAGNGARINTFDPSDPGGSFFNLASDLSNNANATTYTEYSSGMMDGWAQSSAYVLKGSISSNETWDQQAGGYFRDELYFATANGLPAELSMTFSVRASGYVQDIGTWVYNETTDDYDWVSTGSGRASLNLGLNVPIAPITTPVDWHYLSNHLLVNATSVGGFDLTSQVTLKSTDSDPDYLVQSGTYLPFTVSLWGTVNHANLDWGDTVELVDVHAFQDGVELGNSQFTIQSNNDEGYFADFAHTMDVPEPGTLFLALGLGLVVVVAGGRRGPMPAAVRS
jgi:hypothetical protein